MLRPYQTDVLNRVRESLRTHRGVIAVLPCRSGKSYIMAEMVSRAVERHKRVLILAHRKILLRQHKKLISECRIESVFTEVRHLGENGDIDLIIIDEAHISGCDSYRKVCDYYSHAKIVGFTATPARADGKPLDLYQDIVVGISAKELIGMGMISDYDYYAPKLNIDLRNVSVVNGDFSVSETEKVMTDRKIYGDIVSNYRKLSNGSKAIAYCVDIKHAQEMAELFNSNGIKAVAISSFTPQEERDQAMDGFINGDTTILCNCNLISEGITIPDCDCCLLLRPTKSLPLYIQQACRCLTPRKGKKAVIIDYVGNVFEHGMPTDDHDWSLTDEVRSTNRTRDPDVLVRICNHCFRAYPSSIGRICPFCGKDNGKTKKEIETEEKAELERITEIKKKEAKREQGMARNYEELVQIGIKRGYKNPYYWAKIVMSSRKH